MKYFDVIDYPRSWDRRKYPFVAQVAVGKEDFREIEALIADQSQAKVLGHDLGDNDQIIIHVACTTEQTKGRMETQWA